MESQAFRDSHTGECNFMSNTVSVALSEQQCEILLRGLRYVRSSLIFDVRDPDEKLDPERASELKEIAALSDQLSSRATRETSTVS